MISETQKEAVVAILNLRYNASLPVASIENAVEKGFADWDRLYKECIEDDCVCRTVSCGHAATEHGADGVCLICQTLCWA